MATRKPPSIQNYVVPARWTIGAIITLMVLCGSSVAFFITQKTTLENQVSEANKRTDEAIRISSDNNSILKQMQADTRVQLKEIEQRQQLFEIRLTAIEITVGLSKKN
jgi:hypothetical protein